MNFSLLKSLIDNNKMGNKVELDANIPVKIFASNDTKIENQHFGILKARVNGGDINFDCMSTVNGAKISINWKNITAIDGMTPERYAAVFDIDPNGNLIEKSKQKTGPKKYKE